MCVTPDIKDSSAPEHSDSTSPCYNASRRHPTVTSKFHNEHLGTSADRRGHILNTSSCQHTAAQPSIWKHFLPYLRHFCSPRSRRRKLNSQPLATHLHSPISRCANWCRVSTLQTNEVKTEYQAVFKSPSLVPNTHIQRYKSFTF